MAKQSDMALSGDGGDETLLDISIIIHDQIGLILAFMAS
jgi:hypothetical protein